MECILNNETDVEAIIASFDGESQQFVKVEAGTDLEKVKDLLKQTSDLPNNGFRFFTIRLKDLSSEDKAELIKYVIKEELCVTSIIETLVLMVIILMKQTLVIIITQNFSMHLMYCFHL